LDKIYSHHRKEKARREEGDWESTQRRLFFLVWFCKTKMFLERGKSSHSPGVFNQEVVEM